MEIIAGKLDDGLVKNVKSVAKSKKLELPRNWNQGKPKIAMFGLLNLGAVCLFTAHVSKLEGFKNSGEAIDKSAYPNLPWWMYSVWLPVPMKKPWPPEQFGSGVHDFLLGSSFALAKELADIQKRSKLKLGTEPMGYSKMKADYIKWFRSDNEELNDKEIIQWIWLALWEAAQLSIEKSVPLWGAE